MELHEPGEGGTGQQGLPGLPETSVDDVPRRSGLS